MYLIYIYLSFYCLIGMAAITAAVLKKIALLWPILVRGVLGTKALINLSKEKKENKKEGVKRPM